MTAMVPVRRPRLAGLAIPLLLLQLAAGATASLAKCGNVRYEIPVRVLERGTNCPLADAQVLFFLPGESYALTPYDDDSYRRRTDRSGAFRGDVLFNTYSGWFLSDLCGAELSSLQVVVVPTDRPAERFDFRGLHAVPTAEEDSFRLPTLTVRLFPRPGG